MTKVRIDPGPCGFITYVTVESEDETDVKIHVKSGCESVRKMMETLGEDFDAYELCLVKPGQGPLYEYAGQNFPVHVSCPVINGIIKAVEVECHLALKHDVSISYVD